MPNRKLKRYLLVCLLPIKLIPFTRAKAARHGGIWAINL